MSTDAFGGQDAGAMVDVREGMRVLDSTDKDVGVVELVELGDPEAATPQGQPRGGGLLDGLRESLDASEPRVPDQAAAQLTRTGFVKVDGKGMFGPDLYVAPDQVSTVSGDVVHLAVTADELIRRT